MRKPTGSATTSGGSATYGNFSDIILNGDFAMGCAKFWKKFTPQHDLRNSRIEPPPRGYGEPGIRESIHNSRSDNVTIQVLNTLPPHLPLAVRRDRQLRMREALPQSSKRKRDRPQIPQTRLQPVTQKSLLERRRPSTRNPPAGVLYKCAPIPELYLATLRRHRSLCLRPFRWRRASNHIGRSFAPLSAANVRNKDTAFCRPRQMRAGWLVRPCTPRSFQLVIDCESVRQLKVTSGAEFVKQTR